MIWHTSKPYTHGPVIVACRQVYVEIMADIVARSNRRDELESLGYLLVFLYSGSLPLDELADQTNVELTERCKAATDEC